MQSKAKSDAYQILTDRIITLLEAGTVPWHKPWKSAGLAPQNLISRHEYRGINPFLLNSMMYESPYWLTFKQALELGGNVKRGEKATPVVFWKWLEKQEDGQKKRIPFLRYYSVFNIAQCENIPADKLPATTTDGRTHNPIEQAEKIVAGMPVKPVINHRGSQACYSPGSDVVTMPPAEAFHGDQEYYSTLFHELTHATGHESRLNRKGVAGTEGNWSAFGSNPYAKEELVAEMGAAFLCGQAGIVERTIDNSAAYLKSWLAILKADSKLVIQAAAQAQKAADFILDRKHETTTTENGGAL